MNETNKHQSIRADTCLLLSVMVTGPLRKQVLVRKALLGRVLAEIMMGKASKSASGRPSAGRRTDFEVLPIKIRQKLGPKVPSLLKPAILEVRSP